MHSIKRENIFSVTISAKIIFLNKTIFIEYCARIHFYSYIFLENHLKANAYRQTFSRSLFHVFCLRVPQTLNISPHTIAHFCRNITPPAPSLATLRIKNYHVIYHVNCMRLLIARFCCHVQNNVRNPRTLCGETFLPLNNVFVIQHG